MGIYTIPTILAKINFIQHLFPTDLVEAQIGQGHCLAGVVEQSHYQADVVVTLDVDPVGPGLTHRVGTQVVDVQELPYPVHDVVKLTLIDVLVRTGCRREEPFRLTLVAVAFQPLLIDRQVVGHRAQVEGVGLAGLLILDEGMLPDGPVVIEDVGLLES